MFMVMLVLDDPAHLDAVIDAWESAGIGGATIIASTGINRRRLAKMVGATFMAGINRLISTDEESHCTLFAIVGDEDLARRCLEATEGVVGNLDAPNTGVFAAWPLHYVKGVPASKSE